MRRVKAYISEFITMKAREMVTNPQEKIALTNNSQMSRQSLKHFVESRTAEGLSRGEIDYLIAKAPEVIKKPELNIPNPKQEKYPGSTLLGKLYPEKGKAVMVLLDKEKEIRDILSIHYKSEKGFRDALLKAIK